jgi:Ca-activated chloride channel family protein
VGYFKWIKSYWFFEQSNWNKISNFLYGLAIFLFLLALLDLRGPEMKVRANLPDQRTLIVLDSSLSMLSEDIRPNRFVKSLQLARHFVKGAAGHQIAIVLFSDLQKRIIPFTDDIDLLDSRLAALEKTNAVSGGTNISQAITEAAGYFESDSKEETKDSGGNILVFTDAEEGEEHFKLNLNKNINLALVGVGTAKGGNIPLRYDDGAVRGYKTVKGEQVITKLDENYIRELGKGVTNFRYWIANSYSLPTEEVMNFFRSIYNTKHNNGDMRVRPVFSHYILIPAIAVYCLSVLLGRFHSLRMIKSMLLIFLLAFGITKVQALDEEPKELPPEIKKDLSRIREGKASRVEILKTAEKLLKAKEEEKATELYSEYTNKKDEEAIHFNHATSLLKASKIKEALPLIQELLNKSNNEDLKNKMRSNLSIALKNQKEEKDQKKQDKEDDKKDNNENKDKDQKDQKDDQKKEDKNNKQDNKKNDKQEKGNQNKKDNKDKSGKEKSEDKDKKEKEKEKDKEKNKDKDKDKNKGDEGEKPEEQKPQTLEQKEKEIEQKRRMTKTPGMIKQIMSDDRELQKKLMDTSTKEKGDLKPQKDW